MKTSVRLLDVVATLGATITEYFPEQRYDWPDAIGLSELLPSSSIKNGGYDCTPLNSKAFAWTGTEGQHFSFLVQANQVNADSPIILTAPDHYWAENVIVAKNFHTFLRLALHHGCFQLTELAYAPETAIHTFAASAQPTRTIQNEDDERQARIRRFVADWLELSPYDYTVAEFKALQQRYQPLLKMPPEYTTG